MIKWMFKIPGLLGYKITKPPEARNDPETAKTDFISLVAHRLRTPLGVSRWNLEMLLGGDMGEINQDVEHTLQELYETNQKLILMVNDLLDVSRIDQRR